MDLTSAGSGDVPRPDDPLNFALVQVTLHPFHQAVEGSFRGVGNKAEHRVIDVVFNGFKNPWNQGTLPKPCALDKCRRRFRVRNRCVQSCKGCAGLQAGPA